MIISKTDAYGIDRLAMYSDDSILQKKQRGEGFTK